VWAPNIPGWDDFPLLDTLTRAAGPDAPVVIDSDRAACIVGETWRGAARGARDAVLLTIGTGIGGGLILNGQIYRGSSGAGAELGHMTIDEDGPPCQGTCRGVGHLEAFASGTAVAAAARRLADERPDGDLGRARAAGERLDGRHVVELARRGDGDARSVVARAGEHLGVGIANYVNVFNPEVVVVGGGFAAAGDLLLEPARRIVAERALVPSRDQVRIVTGELGARAGLVGAALVGFEALDRSAA
jgi:glucokinase